MVPPPPLHALLASLPRGPASLIPLLHAVQHAYGHIPSALRADIASHAGVPVAQVNSVVGFYHLFSDTPRGEYRILLSDHLTDRFAGSAAIRAILQQRLGLDGDACRHDGRVSVQTTSCIGLADQGPAALVNGLPLTRLTPARARRMASLIAQQVPLSAWPKGWFHIDTGIRQRGPLLRLQCRPGEALRRALQAGPEALLASIAQAGLRGGGGAGYPTARKWQQAREAPGPHRVILCNADEGEPGTFKDRALLATHAEALIEGMTLAALAVGADQGYLYLRGEYAWLAPSLQAALQRRRDSGLLGRHILGSALSFDITLYPGAGAYVCGEETALIESLEGRRGLPRLKPPFPVRHGYLGYPTVCNNVETLVQVTRIVLHGAEAFAAHGCVGSPGTKLVSIAGDVARPGVYEVDFGTDIHTLLTRCGAGEVQAVQVGGPSGTLLPPAQFGRRLAFDDLPTGGALMVFGPERDLLAVVRHHSHFFAFESCGFCTPCRVGTRLLARAIDRVCDGLGSPLTLAEVRELLPLLQQTSHCGLGKTAGNPWRDLLQHFPALLDRRLHTHAAEPVFDVAAALDGAMP